MAGASSELSNGEDGDDSDMVKSKKNTVNFIYEYVGNNTIEIDRFLDNWTTNSEISLNFTLTEHINEPIGGKILKKARRNSAKNKSSLDTSHDSSGYENDQLNASQSSSQEGLELRLDIDNKKHVVIRLYASFGNEFKVYIVKERETLAVIRDSLMNSLQAREINNKSRVFTPIRLYTQDIVLTYKVLYAAFNFDQANLVKHFRWHAFDVAWWMVNDCPNRGPRNKHSSLSLVATTKWARKYHHFLHISKKNEKSTSARVGVSGKYSALDRQEYLMLKDRVKSGKTAILKPLIEEILNELLKRNQLTAYQKVEIPSRLTMAQMMVQGIGLNMKYMKNELDLYDDLSQQLTDIAQKYYAKSAIRLTSKNDVARVLYVDLDLKKHLLDHSTNSNISKDPTNAEILNILSAYHPFPKMVQDYRKIGKALDALQSVNTHARFNSELDMMRVFGHCDFWQLTGRVAMSDPDLFLINRNFIVTIPAHGNRQEERLECVPRKCFVPQKGWQLVAADYSQLELRLMAHFSDDSNLLEILNRSANDPTFDVFRTVASKVYNKPLEDVTDENRQHAKQICYGIIYGMGNKSLSIQLKVNSDEAEQFRQDFFDAFPMIRVFTENLVNDCADKGYVESLLGRRRRIEDINSEVSSARSRAERVAINTRIQSSASDIIKLAMQMVNQKILDNYYYQAKLVLEMHDELIYEIDPKISNHFTKSLKATMEEISILEGLKVKLTVNLKTGTNWSNLEKLVIDDD